MAYPWYIQSLAHTYVRHEYLAEQAASLTEQRIHLSITEGVGSRFSGLNSSLSELGHLAVGLVAKNLFIFIAEHSARAPLLQDFDTPKDAARFVLSQL